MRTSQPLLARLLAIALLGVVRLVVHWVVFHDTGAPLELGSLDTGGLLLAPFGFVAAQMNPLQHHDHAATTSKVGVCGKQ